MNKSTYLKQITKVEVTIPEQFKTTHELEAYFGDMDRNVQVRVSDPKNKPPEYEERIPFIMIELDWKGIPHKAYLHYIK